MCEDPTDGLGIVVPDLEGKYVRMLLCHPFRIRRRGGAFSRGAYARRQVYIIPAGF